MHRFAASRARIDLDRVQRVLAVKLSSFGDIVHVTPCLRALRRACPQAELLVAVDRTWADVLRHDPHLDGVITADPSRGSFLSSWLDARRVLAAWPGARFDLAIDFQGLPRSAAWVYASGARWRAGRGGLRPGWQVVVTPDTEQHAVRVCAEVAERVGTTVDDLEPRLYSAEPAERAIHGKLAAAGVASRFIVVNPFGTWRSKIWPPDRWAALIARVRAELDAGVVISGGPGEEVAAQELRARLAPSPPPSLAGRMTLEEAIALYRRAALVVSGDSGPAHAAAAVGTPVVALFGPTWPEQTGPWGQRHCIIQASRGASHRAYRDDEARRHMEAIGVEMVFEAVAAAYRENGNDAARAADGAEYRARP